MRRREGKVGGMEGGLEQGASYHIGSHYHRIIKTHSGAEINCGEGFFSARVERGGKRCAFGFIILLGCYCFGTCFGGGGCLVLFF